MNIAYQIKKWDMSHPVAFTILRVILGVCLATKGMLFLNNTIPLEDLIKRSSLNALNLNAQLTLLITWVHILGGTFITLGLFTKISTWAQIPIVLGAIIFINLNTNIVSTYSDLLFSIFILVLLVMVVFEGGGVLSMDNYVKRHLL
jgi:putative oxidoreductase